MKATNSGLNIWLDFETNERVIKDYLVVYTRFFNERLRISPKSWLCFVIPQETRIDGASIPRILRPIAGLSGMDKEVFLPSISHDYMYEFQEVTLFEFNKETREVGKEIGAYEVCQKEADYFMESKMKDMGANLRQRKLTLFGLRLRGFRTWDMYKNLINNK